MAWSKQGSLKGPKGETGTRGSIWFTSNGAPGATGVTLSPSNVSPQTGDMCLDTTTGDVYQF